MKKQSGMTLIELMIAVAVGMLLMTMAAPSFRSLIERNQVQVVSNELQSSLFMIRSYALKRRQTTSLCPANSSGTACGEIGNYGNGWLAYIDCNNDGAYSGAELTCDIDNDGLPESRELLKVLDISDKNVQIKPTGNLTQVSFGFSGRGNSGSFCISADNKTTQKIIMSPTGRIRTEKNSDCTVAP